MNDRITSFLTDLDRVTEGDPAAAMECLRRCVWLRSSTPDEVSGLFRALLDRHPPTAGEQDDLLAAGLAHLVTACARMSSGQESPVGDAALQQVASLYQHLGTESKARSNLFCLLTAVRTPASLQAFAALATEEPPQDATIVAVAFSPLFRRRDYDPSTLFPRLLDGLMQPSTSTVILDLANYLTREGVLPQHPAAERSSELASMLGGVVGHLGRLEATRPADNADAMETSRRINDGVALTVSLCDALGLIGDRAVTGRLYQAMELGHRRIRAEAAAALARLGEQRGIETLVQLAAEPVTRLRVLAYAKELGVLDQVDSQYQTEQSKAEADLTVWLANPAQMGLPPNDMELLDSREQCWPGFDGPVLCFLFRFSYRIGEIQFSNIGIAGPVAHAFGVDLTELPPGDIYAAFAGWHAEHDEIYEVDAHQWDTSQRLEVARLQRRLHDDGFDSIQPLTLGYFLGDTALIAGATRDGVVGTAVADQTQIHWLPRADCHRPPGPEEAYNIYKGRKFLHTFNPPED